MSAPPIYLDYNATTPLDPAVVQAMLPALETHFGNPSSSHAYGRFAQHLVQRGRLQLAELLGASAEEIIFTGNGTEASNHAIRSIAQTRWDERHRWQIITSTIEHPATMEPCLWLRQAGFPVTFLPVDRHGVVEVQALEEALKQPTLLVSIMHSNNEIGTLEPIAQIAKLAKAQGAVVHTDVAQSLGKVPVDVDELGVDLITVAGHKLYAPKGIGALYVRTGTMLPSFILGAGHERGRRAGTENVPYIVGLGQAAEIAQHTVHEATGQLRLLRDRLWSLIETGLGDRVTLHGHPTERLPNTLNFSVAGWIGEELLEACPAFAGSTGAACHAGKVEVSHVHTAMGVPLGVAKGAIRLSVGRYTTMDEVERAAVALVGEVLSY
jgi:cysteine desulfurase